MALTITYDATLGRLRLSATLLGAAATKADFRFALPGRPLQFCRGGVGRIVSGQNASLDVYEFPPGQPVDYYVNSYDNLGVQQTFYAVGAFAQDVTEVWLKSIARPFLNMPVTVAGRGDVSRPARAGVFDVKGRSFPVAVSDVRGSRQYRLDLLTQTPADEKDLDLLIASGDPLYLQAPSSQTKIPGGEGTYWTVGDSVAAPTARLADRRVFALPLTEIAAPGPDVVGSTSTWQTVVSTYATWTDVLAAKATWADLLQLVGNPSEVIVP